MRDSLSNRSRSSRSPLSRSLLLIVILVLLSAALLLLDRTGRLEPFRSQLQALFSPVLGIFQGAGQGVGQIGQNIGSNAELRTRNAELESQISAMQDEHLQMQALKLENEQLRKQLGIEQASPWELLSVDVVAVTPDVGRHIMLINKGSDDGVEVGMGVIAQEGTSPTALVGVVEQVGPRSARVLLISDYSSELSVKVYHNGEVTDGVVQGQFQRGAWLRLEEVDRSIPLAEGDQVLTAGLTAQMDLDLPNAAIPSNVPIGVVQRVWLEGYRQYAELRPYIAPDQIRYAWVILSHDE